MFTKEAQELAKPCYEAIKKISTKGINPMTGAHLTLPEWEWEPQIGDWCIHEDKARLVAGRQPYFLHIVVTDNGDMAAVLSQSCIPLINWETIEEILEGMGYEIIITKLEGYVKCRIYKGEEQLVLEQRKTRQEAVMRSVITLAKES